MDQCIFIHASQLHQQISAKLDVSGTSTPTFMALGKGATVAVQLLRDLRTFAISSESPLTCGSTIAFNSMEPPDSLFLASAAFSAAFDSLESPQAVRHAILELLVLQASKC